MKKVGIITFHHAKHSMGACLQALATLRAIESLGYDAELINYTNTYEQKDVKTRGLNLKQRIRMYMAWMARTFLFGGIKNPNKNFNTLDKLYKHVSKKYLTVNDLEKSKYDILVAGSDQIWNPDVTNGIDKCFLLDFNNSARRISYASSVGSYKFSEDELKTYKKALSCYSHLSVREKYAADCFRFFSNMKIDIVCDPTLLLTGEQWKQEFDQEISSISVDGPYILTYFVGGNIESYWNRIEKYVQSTGLKVYNVQSHSKKYRHVDKALYNITPGELVAYIDKAELILTDSFHGTAFSINLKKTFVVVLNQKNPKRVQNLLEIVGLEMQTDDVVNGKVHLINYDCVDKKLEDFRCYSQNWLDNALRGGNENGSCQS